MAHLKNDTNWKEVGSNMHQSWRKTYFMKKDKNAGMSFACLLCRLSLWTIGNINREKDSEINSFIIEVPAENILIYPFHTN